VSGRAGRREKRGKVVLQTSSPHHPLFKYVIENNVLGFIQDQLRDREEHLYPPYSRLIEINIKHTDKKIAQAVADTLVKQVKAALTNIRIIGPGEPMISKIRNEYLMMALLKIRRDQGKLHEIKSTLTHLANELQQIKEYRNVKIVFDVDPA
jgi:primosomal protein N' (replication factor Y)